MLSPLRLGSCLALLTAPLFAQSTAHHIAPQREIAFERVVDSTDLIPGTSVAFTSLRSAAIDGPMSNPIVAFHGGHFLGPEGIHRWENGVLTTVVDTLTPIPGFGPNDTFVGVSDPSLSQGQVCFTGARDVPGLSFEGCFTDIGGLTLVAGRGDPVPDVPGLSYLHFFTSSMSQGAVGFTSIVSGPAGTRVGVYSTAGAGLHTVVDTTSPMPGGGTFTDFCFNGTIDSGSVTFCGGGSFNPGSPDGVFSEAGGLHAVATTSTPIPGGSGTFTNFLDSPVIRAGHVAFRATGSGGQKGIYSDVGGLGVVADTSTPIPNGTGTFTGFNDFSYHGPPMQQQGYVAFLGQGSAAQAGIYTNLGGRLTKVIDKSDLLDGKTPLAFDLGREAFDRRHIVFTAYFTDGSAGVYVARVR